MPRIVGRRAAATSAASARSSASSTTTSGWSARTTSGATCRSRSVRVRVHPRRHGLRPLRARLRRARRRLPRHRSASPPGSTSPRAASCSRNSPSPGPAPSSSSRKPTTQLAQAIRERPDRPRPLRRPGPRAALEVLQAGNAAERLASSACPCLGRRPARAALVSARAEHQHRLPPLRQPRHRAPTSRGRRCPDGSQHEHAQARPVDRRRRGSRPRPAAHRRADRREAWVRSAPDAHATGGRLFDKSPEGDAVAARHERARAVREAAGGARPDLHQARADPLDAQGHLLSRVDRGARDAAGRRAATAVRRDPRAGRGQPRRQARGRLRLLRASSRSARHPSRRRIARAPGTARKWS